jgi:hypothetical protein
MTPGQTDVKSARAFAEQFGNIRTNDIKVGKDDFGNVGGIGVSYKKNDTLINIDLSYYQSQDSTSLDLLTMILFSLNQGVDPITKDLGSAPVWGDPIFNQEVKNYLLPSILANYGKPSKVLLATWPNDPDRPDIEWHPFSLALLYPEQGIFVEYVSPREISGSNFVGCPSKSHINLGVWSPYCSIGKNQ